MADDPVSPIKLVPLRTDHIPPIGAAVRWHGLRAIVQRHTRREIGPTHLLLRLIEGERAGMVVSTDHTEIEESPT